MTLKTSPSPAEPSTVAPHSAAPSFFTSPLRIAIVVLGVAIAVMAVVRGFLATRAPQAVPSGPTVRNSAPAILGQAPQFDLIERSERPVKATDLKGRVWIANFIFTRCLGPCPAMTANMARIQERLRHVPGVVLVSFSVDPEHDTPQVLREYAQEKGADPQRWWFLTGTIAQIEAVQVKGFKMGMVGEAIHHSDRFVLVDGDGGIRGYFDMNEAGQMEELVARASELARDLPK